MSENEAQGHWFDDQGWCDHCKAFDCDIIGSLEADNAALRERVRVLEEALEQYGDHEFMCDLRRMIPEPRTCTCGYDALLSPAATESPLTP